MLNQISDILNEYLKKWLSFAYHAVCVSNLCTIYAKLLNIKNSQILDKLLLKWHIQSVFFEVSSFYLVLSSLHRKNKEKTNNTLVPHTAWTPAL